MKQDGLVFQLLKKPVTVLMVTILILGFGMFSLFNLKITLLPDVDIPVVAISTNYRDVAPEDMKRLVAIPLENAIASLDRVESIESNIRKGGLFIIMRLEPGTNAEQVEMDAREAIDRIRNQLPREATEPVIFQFDPERRPIMTLSVEAANRGLDELRNLSVEMIEPMLERIEGVASADTRGGLQRNIYVDLNPELMNLHRITPQQVEQALSSNNVQIPIGNLVVDRLSYSVRAMAIYQNIDEINDTIIQISENGVPVRVRDVAEAKDSFIDINTIVEVNGKNSVTIEVQKNSDANTLDVALDVISEISTITASLPPGVSMRVLNNEGQFIEDSIRNLTQSAIVALVLVAIILLIFMGSYRASAVVAFSIPISMTATFVAMYFSGVSLNIISITGLALAVGLLVDNAIVVLDNIAAKLEKGIPVFQAVLSGTNEVKGALFGSTLTTLAVFVPIFFIDGFTGQIAKDLAYTISFAISLSFLASIILIPVFSSKMLRQDSIKTDGFIFRFIGKVESGYEKILRWLVFHKRYMFIFVILIFAGIGFFFNKVPGEFFPDNDTGNLNVNVQLPAGSQLTETATVLRDITSQLLEDERVETVVTNIGQSGFRREANTGRLTVTLVPPRERSQSSDEISADFSRQFTYPGVTTRVFSQSGFGPGGGGGGGFGSGMGSIRVSLVGSDIEELKVISDRIESVMLEDSLVIAVDNPRLRALPEFIYHMDRVQLSKLGLSFNEAANSFRTQTRGSRAGFYRADGREYPIEVRLADDFRRGVDNLTRMQIARVEDQSIPVEAIGFFEEIEGVSNINRRDRETILDVNIRVSGNAQAQRERIIDLLESEIVLPDGYRYEFTGAFRDQQDSARSIFNALIVAIILTFMVMGSKFENIRDPFVIIFSIPLAFFGAYFMLYATGTSFSVPAGIGMLILVGIVVNNGIVLVDYINQNTKLASTPSAYMTAFINSSKRRVRPILLTMLTTICSMIPLALAIGEGSETWSPLARVVIGGLFFSSIFTLFIIPVVYIGIAKKRRKIFRFLKEKSKVNR